MRPDQNQATQLVNGLTALLLATSQLREDEEQFAAVAACIALLRELVAKEALSEVLRTSAKAVVEFFDVLVSNNPRFQAFQKHPVNGRSSPGGSLW